MPARSIAWSREATWALRAVAGLYLLVMFLEGPGWSGPLGKLPSWFVFFAQCTALFPHAARASIEYRAEGYACDDGEWREIDTRRYFPIDEEDKENRFQRVMFFYRHTRRVMRSVDAFLVSRHNGKDQDDGPATGAKIGGVRLFSIRTPIPEVGSPIARVRHRDLSEIPRDWRKVFYETSSAQITERCFGSRPRSSPRVAPEPDPDEMQAEERPRKETP